MRVVINKTDFRMFFRVISPLHLRRINNRGFTLKRIVMAYTNWQGDMTCEG